MRNTEPRKGFGEAVDRRNGRRLELLRAAEAEVPDPPPDLTEAATAAWEAFWRSGLTSVLDPVDDHLVAEWAVTMSHAERIRTTAMENPLVPGSTGQLVEHPLFRVADRLAARQTMLERTLGIGPLFRARLGLRVQALRRGEAEDPMTPLEQILRRRQERLARRDG